MTARTRAVTAAVAAPAIGAGLALVAMTYAVSFAMDAYCDAVRLVVGLMLGGVRP